MNQSQRKRTNEQIAAEFEVLKEIAETWKIIGATFQNMAPNPKKGSAPQNGATAPISERLLRSITCLQPDHQHELVTDLINAEITKAKFNPAWL